VLPEALPAGLSAVQPASLPWWWLIPAAALAAAVWRFGPKATSGLLLVAIFAAAGFLTVKIVAAPPVDRQATARPLWRAISSRAAEVCVGEMHRAWRYGLNYYSVTPLPDCRDQPRPIEIRQEPGMPPAVILLK
jgi:hypothetical protein